MAGKFAHDLNDSEFKSTVLDTQDLVLIDFWAEWCAPCRALAPAIESIAEEYNGKVRVFKMDIDKNQETPAQFAVRGIPTLLVFKGGELVEQLVGNQGKDKVVAALQKHF